MWILSIGGYSLVIIDRMCFRGLESYGRSIGLDSNCWVSLSTF